MAAARGAGPGLPTTRRGLATRSSLVAAARTVFERDGFVGARITDITRTAGTASGSFYTYFAGKDEIFDAVAEAVNAEIHHPPSLADMTPDTADLHALIAQNHRSYLQAYRKNAQFMRVTEQVTNISDTYRRQRTASAQAGMKRNAEAIRALQRAGRADPTLDPTLAARALSVMVSRSAYVTFVLEEETEIDELVETLTHLWVNALGIE